MNRRKNLLCVFFLVLTVLSCALEIDAFATSGGQPATQTAAGQNGSGQQTGADSQTASGSAGGGSQAGGASSAGQPDQGQPTQANPVSSSQAAASSSSKPASSSPVSSKSVRRRSSSIAPVSSDITSAASSDVFSGESSAAENSISLPGVGSVAENDPLSSAITNPEQTHKMNVQGLLAWACIALGVLVVLIVVLSNRRPPRGPGRKRYRRQKHGSGKHLLNDRYYHDLNRY